MIQVDILTMTVFMRIGFQILKIGVSFFEPENIISDVLNTDIQLDLCITPTKVYNF